MRNIDKLPAHTDNDRYMTALEAAYSIGFNSYFFSPDVMPRQFEFNGTVYQWQNKTTSLYAKDFRRGYRTAKHLANG